jgi:hypothetical protein
VRAVDDAGVAHNDGNTPRQKGSERRETGGPLNEQQAMWWWWCEVDYNAQNHHNGVV